MIGALADFGRYAGGLLYWNTRKSVFRLSRGRGRNPCQNPSDSGRAMQTGCEACANWHRPARFARICPLLARTPTGWKCSVNAADVRPFWGRALRFYGISLLSLYLVSAISLFGYLRTIGYPVSILQISWPGLWYKIPQAQSAFFFNEAHGAFSRGHLREGLLELANAYEANPKNYSVAIEYAENIQAGQPYLADAIFGKAMLDQPAQREHTAELWYQALLARADYGQIAKLATAQLRLEPAASNLWMRALVFATRLGDEPGTLQPLLDRPELNRWRPLLVAEIDAETHHTPPALDPAAGLWPAPMPAYGVYYQLSSLMENGHAMEALDLLTVSRARIDPMARVTLRLKGLACGHAEQTREREIRALFDGAYALAEVEIVCAHLIRYPSPGAFLGLRRSMEGRHPEITHESLEAWLSLFCAAGAQRDFASMKAIGDRLHDSGLAPGPVLGAIQSFFRKESAARRVTSFLPFIPLPLEINYALLATDRPLKAR